MSSSACNDVGGNDVLLSSPLSRHSTTPHTDPDIDDIDIHVQFPAAMPTNMPVSDNCQTNIYYAPFTDSACNAFPDNLNSLGSYPYSLQDSHLQEGQLDLNYILVPDIHNPNNATFVHDNAHSMPKHYQSTQDFTSPGPPSDQDDQYHSSPSSSSSLSYVSTLQDLSCSPSAVTTRFALPPSPPKQSGHTHTMLPPIVQSNPADATNTESDVGHFFVLYLCCVNSPQSRALNKRMNTGVSSQVDPYAAAFLREQLGEAKWNTFSARLFERRLGPIKSRMRVRGKGIQDETNSAPGATAIDFLVKVEVVKEVLRIYVPYVSYRHSHTVRISTCGKFGSYLPDDYTDIRTIPSSRWPIRSPALRQVLLRLRVLLSSCSPAGPTHSFPTGPVDRRVSLFSRLMTTVSVLSLFLSTSVSEMVVYSLILSRMARHMENTVKAAQMSPGRALTLSSNRSRSAPDLALFFVVNTPV